MQATSSSLIASIVTPTGSTGRLEGAQLGGKLLHSGPTATVVIGAAAAHPHCSQKELGQLEIVQMDLRKCRGIIRVIPSRVLKAKQSKAKQSKAKQATKRKARQLTQIFQNWILHEAATFNTLLHAGHRRLATQGVSRAASAQQGYSSQGSLVRQLEAETWVMGEGLHAELPEEGAGRFACLGCCSASIAEIAQNWVRMLDSVPWCSVLLQSLITLLAACRFAKERV